MFRRIRLAFDILTGLNERRVNSLLHGSEFPPLGQSSKVYSVSLTEPEINAIHSAASFIQSACRFSGAVKYWNHYGPTLQALSEKLMVFDD